MGKETYIKVGFTEGSEDFDLSYQGSLLEIVYLGCEVFNEVKKDMVKAGINEEAAKIGLLQQLKESLDKFE